MTPEEIKLELARIAKELREEGQKAQQQFIEATKDAAKQGDVDAIKYSFMEFTDKLEDRITELKDIAEKQGLKINELSERGNASPTNPREQLKSALTEKKDELLLLKSGEFNGKVNITLKTVGNQLTTNILPAVSTAVPYSLAELESGITRVARRRPFIRELLNARPISTMYAAWAEQTGVEGGAAAVAEGAAKPQADFDIQEATRKVEKVAAFIKTSRENLADVDAMRNFIEEELFEIVNLKFDTDLYSGTGVSPILKGLTTWAATASVASTPFALGVNLANNWDVIAAQVAIMSNNAFFAADTVLLNPMDYAFMMMEKETTGPYIVHPLSTPQGQAAAGLRIVANPLVATGTFLIMDSNRVSLRIREELNILVGYDGNDLTNNLVTFVGEMRGVLYVKTNYAGAVVKGVFATLKTAMETA